MSARNAARYLNVHCLIFKIVESGDSAPGLAGMLSTLGPTMIVTSTTPRSTTARHAVKRCAAQRPAKGYFAPTCVGGHAPIDPKLPAPARVALAIPAKRLGVRTCAVCKRRFRPDRGDQKVCSVSCQRQYYQGANNGHWGGGRTYDETQDRICVYQTDIYQVGNSKGHHIYRLVHRLVCAEFLGRPLTDDEKVVHIDQNGTNNAHENLYVFPTQSAFVKAINRWHQLWPQSSNLEEMKRHEDELRRQCVVDNAGEWQP